MSTACFFPPEILQNIFQILIDYANKTIDIRIRKFTSLQKCLLVDRYWFSNSVIFLWKNPLRPNHKKNYTTSKLLISTYISCLSESSKNFLYENNIINFNQKISTPFCNYNNYLRDLDFTELFYKVSYFLLNPDDENLDIITLDKSDPIEIIKSYDDDIMNQKRILLFGIDSIDIVKSWSNFQFLPFLTTLKFSTSTLIKLDLELYSDIIKKTNGNLIKLGISLNDGLFFHNIHLFNTISTYCPKLRDFDLKIKGRLLYYIPLILQNCKNLEKINLEIMDDKNITLLMYKIGKELSKNLKSFYIYQEVTAQKVLSMKSELKNYIRTF
ncbi:hypothetical protein GLOIN_2v1762775 [Rhizophagus irregularis DAOM 181602=DAOM 197198]|nr:hypothetical protein GLOIN_2v1762775 [Rhizophagus irregularis DAOM 181602=DAOM 197198]